MFLLKSNAGIPTDSTKFRTILFLLSSTTVFILTQNSKVRDGFWTWRSLPVVEKYMACCGARWLARSLSSMDTWRKPGTVYTSIFIIYKYKYYFVNSPCHYRIKT